MKKRLVFFMGFLMLSTELKIKAFDLTKHQQTGLINAAVLAVCSASIRLYEYVVWTQNIPEKFYVKNSYPLAQVWYDEMAAKYPQAHFNLRKFLSARKGFFNNAVSWESTYNEVYGHPGDLQRIHEIYMKKSQNEEISDEDQRVLDICEFLLLHEAGHIENQDTLHRVLGHIGLLLSSEAVGAVYRDNCSYNPLFMTLPFKIPYILDDKVYADSLVRVMLLGAIFNSYARYQETRADKFACDHADSIEVLQGGKRFFERMDGIALISQDPNHADFELAQYLIEHPSLRWVYDYSKDPIHPSLSTRAEKVQEEINRRLQQLESQTNY